MKGLVVVGASYAGVQAALTARDAGFAKPIAIVGDEPCLPYQRPPLSKDYLLDNASEQSLFLRDNAFFGAKGIELILGSRVIDIDLRDRRAILERGSVLGFEQLVIAADPAPAVWRFQEAIWREFAISDRSQMRLILKCG
ncbi:FAD-dependent oxidoreductase [Bradyrhizobium japonicum]